MYWCIVEVQKEVITIPISRNELLISGLSSMIPQSKSFEQLIFQKKPLEVRMSLPMENMMFLEMPTCLSMRERPIRNLNI